MQRAWAAELTRLALAAGAGAVAGALFGHASLGALAGLLAYEAWQFRNLVRLAEWLHGARGGPLPSAGGLWGDVFHRIYRLQRRNRKRKKKLAKMVGRFRESTNAIPDPTVVLGPDDRIEWWNDAAGRVLGLRHPQDQGQVIGNLLRHPGFAAYLARAEFGDTVEIPGPRDPDQTLCIRVVPYARNRKLLVAQDVTRIKRVEQMRRDFIANVSHELRTPLTVVQGYVEALADSGDECARQWHQELATMAQQVGRMASLVQDLLLLSRLETEGGQAERKRVDVPGLVQMIREDAEALSGGRHEIGCEADPDLWLLGSAGELRSAFSNLVYNAVRYTPEGGTIRIRWGRLDDGRCGFEVEDTGIGIEPVHIPRLTERFYRVDVGRSRAQGGTGLGLAIVKHVLARHGAELEIRSRPGEGSLFRCVFPPRLCLHRPRD